MQFCSNQVLASKFLIVDSIVDKIESLEDLSIVHRYDVQNIEEEVLNYKEKVKQYDIPSTFTQPFSL